MKLALAYSTKDQVELTEQTFQRLCRYRSKSDIIWCDGSTTEAGLAYYRDKSSFAIKCETNIRGGADSAIAWKLTTALKNPHYTHIGLIENDVLLDPDWLEPTMALFEKGRRDGFEVGAVSPRSYVDRILIQRDGYAVMHNVGAGAIIFTREAAEIVLRSFRTHWWPDNVRLFAQISGVDLRTYACFRGQEQFVTTDWGFEAQLARHGLATLALTPAKCQMIGQVPSLEQQGLALTTELAADGLRDDAAFNLYRANLSLLRIKHTEFESPGIIHRPNGGMLFFPHQLEYLAGSRWAGTWGLKWTQGFGPFSYHAGPGGASLSVRVSGSCSFLISGGEAGASVTVTDLRSGFKADPLIPVFDGSMMELSVPGSPVPRTITLEASEGATVHALSTIEPQMLDASFRFDWTQLPEPV